jgi:DNA-binding response OmpR family regulator
MTENELLNKILWIEDDYDVLEEMLTPLSRDGFVIKSGTCAVDAYTLVQSENKFALIVLDILLPLSDYETDIPITVNEWGKEKYEGIGFLRWLQLEAKVLCPVILLTIVPEENSKPFLVGLRVDGYILKDQIAPSDFKERVYEVLKRNNLFLQPKPLL